MPRGRVRERVLEEVERIVAGLHEQLEALTGCVVLDGDRRLVGALNGANIAEKIDLSANDGRIRLTRDIGAITMDLDGIETVDANALGGADTVTVNDLAHTDTDTVDTNLDAIDGTGDNQADTVIVNGTDRRDVVHVTRSASQVLVAGPAAETRITGSEPALDTLRVQTLGGNDEVTVAPDVGDLIVPIVDLGADE